MVAPQRACNGCGKYAGRPSATKGWSGKSLASSASYSHILL
jgi:hypothetical protein